MTTVEIEEPSEDFLLDEIESDLEDGESSSDVALEVIKRPAGEWLTEQYLPYSIYVIRERALMASDGLKPVNRRILYSLYRSRITPDSKPLKAARAAGDALAFHPHGTASVEDALARMAQPFSMRIPLITPFGSVGFVTGDTPAASRYWECRLSREAMELLKEISDGAIEMGKNFDGELDEPTLLPVRWPNDIINGTEGIAVGFASKMPSHNPTETMKAAIALLRKPDLSTKQLLKIMPGPDFPTGGEILEVDAIEKYFESGQGTFTVRGCYRVEPMSRGRSKITFHELPFQISTEKVMTEIRNVQNNGGFGDIASVKDLTDRRHGLRLVIETKAGTNHNTVINELFKKTSIESKFPVSSTVLVDNMPRKSSMIELLQNFIDLRRTCVTNKANTRTVKINGRLRQLDAILAALVDIDKCIKIIRGSESTSEASLQLQKSFKIEEDQAEYILSMQLRRLTKADAIALGEEKEKLLSELNELKLILSDDTARDAVVEQEMKETLKVIASERRTVISSLTADEIKEQAKMEAKAAKEESKDSPCVVTVLADGSVTRSTDPIKIDSSIRKFEHAPVSYSFNSTTQSALLGIGSDGIAHKIPSTYIASGIVSAANSIGISLDSGVNLVGLTPAVKTKSTVGVAVATKFGEVKISKADFPNKDEFPIIKLNDGDEVVSVRWLDSSNFNRSKFVSITSTSNILVYDAETVRASGVAAGGVRSQKLRDGEYVVAFAWVPETQLAETIVASQATNTIKLTPLNTIPPKGKGSQGVLLHKFRVGENILRQAYVGSNISVVAAGTNSVVASPPISARAATGVDLRFPVVFGSLTG